MAGRNYTTGLIITGDASGAVRATALTEQALSNLNSSSRRGAQQTNSAWDQVKASMSGLTGAAALAGAGMVVGFAAMVKSSIDAADNLRDLSKSTSISVENLSGLQMAAKQSGTELEAVATAINKLSVNIAKDGDKFKQLGISAKDPLEAFAQLADVFASIEDPQLRAALGSAALGKAWAENAPLLSEGGAAIRAMVKEGREASGMTAEFAKQADIYNDSMELMKTRISRAATMLGAAFLPELNEMITQIQKATAAGVSFNSVMSGVGNWVAGRDGLTEMGQLTKQIVEQKKKLSVMKTEGGGFYMLDHLLGYSVVDETKKLDAMLQQREIMVADYQAKSTAAAAATGEVQKKISADAIAAFVKGSDAQEKTAHKARAAATHHAAAVKTHVDAIGNELKALQDQHDKLSMSERDYYASTLAAKGASAAQSAMALAVWDANKALEAQKESGDKAKAALDEQIDRYNQLTLSARDYYSLQLTSKGVAPDKQGQALAQFDKNTALEANKQAIDDSRQSLDTYIDSIKNANSAMGDLGSVSSSVFDAALGGFSAMTGALTNMVSALDKNSDRMKENSVQQAAAVALKDQKAINVLKAEQQQIERDNTQASIAGIRQVAGATSQMFAENTKGRQAFHAIEMALSAVEMAMTLEKLVGQAASAILNQGNGDPYSAPVRMGIMAGITTAILATAGAAGAFSSSGGGGSTTVIGVQAGNYDTATSLGSNETSQSINKTYELLKSIHADEYAELRAINKGVQSLADGITNSVTKLFQGGGLIDSISQKATEAAAGSSAGSASSADPVMSMVSMFSSKGSTDSKLINGGIALANASIGNILDGIKMSATEYAISQTTKTGTFGGTKTRQSLQTQDAGAEVTDGLNSVFKIMAKTMISVGTQLGKDVEAQLREFRIPLTMIDIHGLSGEDAVKKVNGAISAIMDNMAASVFGDIIGQYQKLGEGMLETAVRIVSEVAVVKDALATSGLSLADNAIAISDAMVQAAGGLEEFQKQFTAYYDKFYSSTEKNARTQEQINSQLVELGLVLPATREGYRALIESLWLTSDAEQQRYSLLLKLSAGADQYYSALESGAGKAEQSMQALADTASKSISEAFAVLNKAVSAEKKNLSAYVSALSGIASALKNALVKSIPGQEGLERQSAQAQLAGALKSGIMLDQTSLDRALGAVAKPSEGLFSNFVDYQRDFIKTANDIAGLSAVADAQLSEGQQQIDRLDAILENAQSQVDAANGTTIAVMSVEAAIAGLQGAITGQREQAAAQQAKIAADAQALTASRAAEAAANAARVAAAKAAYVAPVPAAAPTGDEPFSWIEAWKNRISLVRSGNVPMSMVSAWLAAESDKGRADVSTLWNGGTLKGYAAGGLHMGGWRVVGENGPELENTGPSRIYSNPQSKALVDNADLIAVINDLRAELRAANATIAENTRNTSKVLKKWDVDGQPAVAI